MLQVVLPCSEVGAGHVLVPTSDGAALASREAAVAAGTAVLACMASVVGHAVDAVVASVRPVPVAAVAAMVASGLLVPIDAEAERVPQARAAYSVDSMQLPMQ